MDRLASVRLSRNFDLGLLTASDTAHARGIDNRADPAHLGNLRRLAFVLEEVQALIGHALVITSAYRSPALNTAVGGVPHSRHALGLAADFTCPEFGSPLEVARRIAGSTIAFDQIIHEYGRWVHLGLAIEGQTQRRQELTICSAAEGYLDGLVGCAPLA